MTIEQRKTSLTDRITNLRDKSLIGQIEGIRSTTLNKLSNEIVKLLKISDIIKEKDCIEHNNSKDLLNRLGEV